MRKWRLTKVTTNALGGLIFPVIFLLPLMEQVILSSAMVLKNQIITQRTTVCFGVGPSIGQLGQQLWILLMNVNTDKHV
jgi:hypothetical protein